MSDIKFCRTKHMKSLWTGMAKYHPLFSRCLDYVDKYYPWQSDYKPLAVVLCRQQRVVAHQSMDALYQGVNLDSNATLQAVKSVHATNRAAWVILQPTILQFF